MFEDDNVRDQISELAIHIATEMDEVDKLKAEYVKRNDLLDAAKEKLCTILQEAGMQSCKLENGLNPKTKINRKYFKAAGVEDYTLHTWLRLVSLGDIIIDYVHWQTLQASLKAYEEQGGEVPGTIINVSLQPTVTMFGKAKFLAEREAKENGKEK